MSKPSETYDENDPESGRLSLFFSLFTCIALAIFCFWLQPKLSKDYPVWSEICLHVGVSFVVAGTVIGVLEFKARRLAEREAIRFRNQVSKDVFQALFGRIVPQEVFLEINDILHSNIVRHDCQYRIIFKEPDRDMPDDYFLIRREVTYRVENLLSYKTTFVARSSHSEDVDLTAAGWKDRNFHLKLFVNKKEVPLVRDKNLFVEGTSMRIAQDVELGPRESKIIAFHGEEPSRISAGRNSYLQATPVIRIEVDVVNEYKDVIETSGVQMNHPAAPEPKPNEIGRYFLGRAFLPGQGFQVLWKEKQPVQQSKPGDSA